MAELLASANLRRTKLYPASVAADLIRREQVLACLLDGLELPLTLVCAPAGYGKSTLLGDWVKRSDLPSAWLSLDPEDNDIGMFAAYLLAAVRTCFPDACEETRSMLAAGEVPGPKQLAACLSNDLEAIGRSFVVILDDYHCIFEAGIHEMLDHLLVHPLPTMHLILASRHDPPLALGTLRAHGHLAEIGVRELTFSQADAKGFLELSADIRLSERSLEMLQGRIEGWPAGLRLAVLAMRSHPDPERFVRDFSGDALKVEDYLAREVLNGQPPGIRDWLRKTSILDRFCAPLCEAVCADPNAEATEKGRGSRFLKLIEHVGLFAVSLDDAKQWYRYHHLFQRLLQLQLNDTSDSESIADLHGSAGRWLDEHGLIEEALSHYLRCSDPGQARAMIVRNRQILADGEQWARIERCLARLPDQMLSGDVDLLILRARLLDKQGRYAEWAELLDRIESILEELDADDAEGRRRQGNVDFMRSAFHYHIGQGVEAMERAGHALERLPQECASERVYALMVFAASLQMQGTLGEARTVLNDALQGASAANPTVKGRLFQTLSFVDWVAADLISLAQTASTMLSFGQTHRLPETIIYGHYFSGAAHYHLAELSKAEDAVLPVASDRYGGSFFMHLMGVQCLAFVYSARGRHDEAKRLCNQLLEFMLETGKTSLLSQAQALKALLELRRGHSAEAYRWAWGAEVEATPAGYHFLVVDLIAARILLDEGSDAALERARGVLDALSAFFRKTHNDRFLIETLALQALWCEIQDQPQTAAARLLEAVSLSRSGGFIQLFVDLGSALVPVFNRLVLDHDGVRYVGGILAAFREKVLQPEFAQSQGSHEGASDALIVALTPRESEVLALLAQRLSNSEIANRLFISPKTVRRHTENIYNKLSVHDRREAVAKGLGLGILG